MFIGQYRQNQLLIFLNRITLNEIPHTILNLRIIWSCLYQNSSLEIMYNPIIHIRISCICCHKIFYKRTYAFDACIRRNSIYIKGLCTISLSSFFTAYFYNFTSKPVFGAFAPGNMELSKITTSLRLIPPISKSYQRSM